MKKINIKRYNSYLNSFFKKFYNIIKFYEIKWNYTYSKPYLNLHKDIYSTTICNNKFIISREHVEGSSRYLYTFIFNDIILFRKYTSWCKNNNFYKIYGYVNKHGKSNKDPYKYYLTYRNSFYSELYKNVLVILNIIEDLCKIKLNIVENIYAGDIKGEDNFVKDNKKDIDYKLNKELDHSKVTNDIDVTIKFL